VTSHAFADIIQSDEQSVPADEYFYMTYARSRPNELVPWIEDNDVPLLTNAIHRWSDAQGALLDMWEYDTRHVIDAGGYNVMASYVTQNGELRSDVTTGDVAAELSQPLPFYPWTVQQYHDWLCEHSDEFAWATVMDYACEERFDKLWSYEDRMDATLDATIQQFDLLDDAGNSYKLLPVLQGRDADEYVSFYEDLVDHGIPTSHLGLGTVCRMSSEKKIVEFEQEIRERTGVDRLHGFGVKIEAFKHGATFESADSQAWVYGPSNGRCSLDAGSKLYEVDMPDHSLERTVESFKNYYSYVTRLQQGTSQIDHSVFDSLPDDELASLIQKVMV
jgi:hypothetical protein